MLYVYTTGRNSQVRSCRLEFIFRWSCIALYALCIGTYVCTVRHGLAYPELFVDRDDITGSEDDFVNLYQMFPASVAERSCDAARFFAAPNLNSIRQSDQYMPTAAR